MSVEKLAEIIKNSDNIVFFCGAGASTKSKNKALKNKRVRYYLPNPNL